MTGKPECLSTSTQRLGRFRNKGLHCGKEIRGAFDVFGVRHTEVDPSRVKAVEHFDVSAGAVGGHAVVGHGFYPSLTGNRNGGDRPTQGFSEGDSNVV